MSLMPLPELKACLARFAGLHVGVIGDFALDAYWTIEPAAALPSVETGLPTQPVSEQRYAAGAAGNVVANLVALGCARVAAFGVVGRDPWGAELLRILQELGADVGGMARQERDWATVVYAKPHVGGREQSRIDFGDFNRIHADTGARLLDDLEQALPRLDALVINAQARAGIHDESLRRRLAALIAANPGKACIVDSRDPAAMVPGCALKINDREAAGCCGIAIPPEGHVAREQTLAAANQLFARRNRPVFVTRGSAGMVVCDPTGIAEVPAVPLEGEVDTVGAGDAALAGIAVSRACGLTPVQAACVGNLAAAVCARKLRQTGTASPAEILALATEAAGS